MANTEPRKVDRIRDRYYRAVHRAETWSSVLFYMTAVLSIVVLLLDRVEFPRAYEAVQVAFLVFAIAGFILGLVLRLHWVPKAAEKALADSVSSAFDVNLTHERRPGYYDNAETDPFRKIGMQTLENGWFTKEILSMMSRRDQVLVVGYALIWIVALVTHATSIDLIVVISQVLFSEELVSRFVRLLWFRGKVEKLYDSLFRNLQTVPSGTSEFAALVIEALVSYENLKASSGITLSETIFNQENERLSAEWRSIRDGMTKAVITPAR